MNDRQQAQNQAPAISTAKYLRSRKLQRVIIKGQDRSRWTDFYHAVLTAPWWLFLIGLATVFLILNVGFALLYLSAPNGIEHARPGSFWDRFLFSVQTIGSINYSVMVPKSAFVNSVVVVEAFMGFLYLAIMASLMFARLSRPSARVVFSKVAVVAPFDGVPTLMFRAANQRGNQILDAAITVTLAYRASAPKASRCAASRNCSWCARDVAVHPFLDGDARARRNEPARGLSPDDLCDRQMELIVLLRGTDDTLADLVYVRHATRRATSCGTTGSSTCSR